MGESSVTISRFFECRTLACTKREKSVGSSDSMCTFLLENETSLPQVHKIHIRKNGVVAGSSYNSTKWEKSIPDLLVEDSSTPKSHQFEQFLKKIVDQNSAKETAGLLEPVVTNTVLQKNEKVTGSTLSLNSIHSKIWNVVPLLRRQSSCSSLDGSLQNGTRYCSYKDCKPILTLSRSSTRLEPIKAQNRLRSSSSTLTCFRCSSLLSLAANESKYSLNIAHGQFTAINANECTADKLSPSNSCTFLCKLCLGDFTTETSTRLMQCNCIFCTKCMEAYVEFEILEGAYEISCPDAFCPKQGILSLREVSSLTTESLLNKHKRYRLNREVEVDINRTWCPRAGCETVCVIDQTSSSKSVQPTILLITPCSVRCPTCLNEFCSNCKNTWHPTMSCDENSKQLAANGHEGNIGIPFDTDLIKCCPMCAVPIEKDEGCAQMMCKRCKHVFCWYCLTSLDDDFLLRHYDKGPCKNKLGHSRASVVWHRAQVIGIFAGFGILLLVASPLLLLAAPCIVCCKCRICSGAGKLEENETDFNEFETLQT